ncbi:MAG: hypothetical protein ACI8V2_000798 [Candidatus Latescibacterota bacterium]|jgi:hypothetical protein
MAILKTRQFLIVLFLVTIPLSGASWWTLLKVSEADALENGKKTSHMLLAFKDLLSQQVEKKLILVDALAAFASLGKEIEDVEFHAFAQALNQEVSSIRSLQLAPKGVVTHIFPFENNSQVFGHKLLEDPNSSYFSIRALESKKATIQGPVDLIQGGRGLIIRKPIFIDDEFWGFATIVFDYQDLIGLAQQLADTIQRDLFPTWKIDINHKVESPYYHIVEAHISPKAAKSSEIKSWDTIDQMMTIVNATVRISVNQPSGPTLPKAMSLILSLCVLAISGTAYWILLTQETKQNLEKKLIVINQEHQLANLFQHIAHNINNMLAIIQGNLDMIKELPMPEVAKHRLKIIKNQTVLAADLVQTVTKIKKQSR